MQATLDWFPFHGAFHLSPGLLVYNGNQVKATAAVPGNQTFTLGGANYASDPSDPVHGSGRLEFNKAAPMVLVGWGNLIPRSGRRFSIPLNWALCSAGRPHLPCLWPEVPAIPPELTVARSALTQRFRPISNRSAAS